MSPTEPYTVLQRYVLFMVLLNAISVPIMLSSVNVALPAIAEDLSLSALSLSWIPTAFLMASAMFVLIFGRLADMYGRKKIFLTGAVAVILASLLAASANSAALLITARFLQGFGAAMLYATQMAIVSSVFPAATRGRVIGLVVSVIYFGLAGGPLLGGLLVDQLGWRANFLLQIPIAVLVLFVGVYKVKGEWVAEEKGTFDFSGALNYSLAIFVICLGVSLLPRQYSYLIIAAGLFGVVVFFPTSENEAIPYLGCHAFFHQPSLHFFLPRIVHHLQCHLHERSLAESLLAISERAHSHQRWHDHDDTTTDYGGFFAGDGKDVRLHGTQDPGFRRHGYYRHRTRLVWFARQ